VPLEDLVLMPEVDARRALRDRSIAFSVLAPVGAYAGRGVLRVLRARPLENRIELVCGYESYERFDKLDGPSTSLRMTTQV
jgi:hypothetical protein